MPKTKAIIKIQNVVASGTLNQKVDLSAVARGYPGVEYRPEQFPWSRESSERVNQAFS